MQRIDEEQERRDREIPEYWRRMQELRKPRFARVCPAIHDQLNYEYIGYTASRVYAHNTDTRSVINFQGERYEYNDMIMPLQKANDREDGAELLLKQLGPLDAVFHSYQKFNRSIGCKINFPAHPTDFADQQQIMSATLAEGAEFPYIKESMTRTLANWIVAEVERSPEELAEYSEALPELKRLLALPDASLTYAIRAQYYPLPALESRIKTAMEMQPLYAAMFDPATSYEDKEKLILSWLRNQIDPKQAPTSYFGLFRQMITGTEPEQAKVGDNKNAINSMYENLAAIRIHLWRQKLECLVGRIASDGGPYTGRIDGILSMLMDAKFYLNDSGAMVLDYDKSFQGHLAKDYDHFLENDGEMKKLDSFEIEIRHVLKLLGLQLVPDQDFYDNHVVAFTKESTRTLMDWGYHISKDHCKKLLKAGHDLKKLDMVAAQTPALADMPEEMHLALMTSVAPSLPVNEVHTMNALRLGK